MMITFFVVTLLQLIGIVTPIPTAKKYAEEADIADGTASMMSDQRLPEQGSFNNDDIDTSLRRVSFYPSHSDPSDSTLTHPDTSIESKHHLFDLNDEIGIEILRHLPPRDQARFAHFSRQSLAWTRALHAHVDYPSFMNSQFEARVEEVRDACRGWRQEEKGSTEVLVSVLEHARQVLQYSRDTRLMKELFEEAFWCTSYNFQYEKAELEVALDKRRAELKRELTPVEKYNIKVELAKIPDAERRKGRSGLIAARHVEKGIRVKLDAVTKAVVMRSASVIRENEHKSDSDVEMMEWVVFWLMIMQRKDPQLRLRGKELIKKEDGELYKMVLTKMREGSFEQGNSMFLIMREFMRILEEKAEPVPEHHTWTEVKSLIFRERDTYLSE